MRYAPVGECIYCGLVDIPSDMKRFHDEHIGIRWAAQIEALDEDVINFRLVQLDSAPGE